MYSYELHIDNAGTPGDPTDDEFLELVGDSLRGNFDDPGLCELARRYLP